MNIRENKTENPEDFSNSEDMSKAQETYLKELSVETGEDMETDLSREEAAEKIEQLEEASGKRESEENENIEGD